MNPANRIGKKRKERLRFHRLAAAAVLAAAVTIAGCSGQTAQKAAESGSGKEGKETVEAAKSPETAGTEAEADSGYKKIVDDFWSVITVQDQDSASYDRALEAVGAYLEDSGPESLKTAQDAVKDTIAQMEADAQTIVPCELDEDFSQLLREYGIDPEEYKINADMRSGYLAGFLNSLDYLDYYLDQEAVTDITREDLEFTYDYDLREQKLLRAYCFSSVNYWFAEWEPEAVDYVKEQVADRLVSFKTEDSVWEDSRSAVERRGNLYLDEIEKMLDEWTEFIGERQELLYQMEKEQMDQTVE